MRMALLADAVQECSRVAGQDLGDGGVAQHGVQPADARGQLVGRTPAAGALDGFDGVANAVDAIADGMRKIAIEQEEFQNAVGREIGCVDLAVGFKRSATTEQAYQFKILVTGVDALVFLKSSGW